MSSNSPSSGSTESSPSSTASNTSAASTAVVRRPATRYGGERRPRVYARVQYDDLQHLQQQQQQQQQQSAQTGRTGRSSSRASGRRDSSVDGNRAVGDGSDGGIGRGDSGGGDDKAPETAKSATLTPTISASNNFNLKENDNAGNETPKFYSCDLCDYKSKYRNHVQRHYLRHTEDKPFKCHLCQFEAKERYRFNKHLVSAHPEEVDASQDQMEGDDKPFK